MRTFARSLALLTLLIPPLLSHAYPPPCQRGDLYVGGTSYREANCVERRSIKSEKAERLQQAALRKIAPPATRRTQSTTIREIYLHPVTSRKERVTLIKGRNVQLRKHSVRMQTIERSLRPSQKERGMTPGMLRQDRRPTARVTPRSKHAREKKSFLERKALRRGMR